MVINNNNIFTHDSLGQKLFLGLAGNNSSLFHMISTSICPLSGVSDGRAGPFRSHGLHPQGGKFRLFHLVTTFQKGKSKGCKTYQGQGLEYTAHNVHSILLVKEVISQSQI